MTKMTALAFAAKAASVLSLLALTSSMSVAAPLASAAPPLQSAVEMPLSSKFRACDFSSLHWVDAGGYARPLAHLAHVPSGGTGTVVASVDINTALPDTRYDVRVIQLPRPSNGCAPGAPGVISGSLQTDGLGAGNTTLQGAQESGATGAWVIVERPAEYSQTPAEFYSSTFIAAI